MSTFQEPGELDLTNTGLRLSFKGILALLIIKIRQRNIHVQKEADPVALPLFEL